MSTDNSDVSKAFRAVHVTEATDPSLLLTVDVTQPEVSAGEVLIEVRAAAVNRSDALSVRGLMPMTTFPRVPGRDFAGLVAAGPPELQGQRVWGAGGADLGFTQDGTHAEFVIVPAEAAVPIPECLSFDEAAAGALAYFTAYEALGRAGAATDDMTGTTVLVTGAVGAVGTAAVSLASSRGARVIGAVRGPDECLLAEAAGLDAVIDTEKDEVPGIVREATGGSGVQFAVDTVGGGLLAPVLASLAVGGGVCVISSAPKVPIGFDVLDFYRSDLRLAGLNTGRLDCRRAARILRELHPGFESGILKPPRIAARHPLSDAAAAYRAVEVGAGGRVLIHPMG